MSSLAKSTLFPAQLATEIFSKVTGHSTLAKLSAEQPLPFNGKDFFTFNFANKVSIVGEGAAKPAGDAVVTAVQIRPVKVVYQGRVDDEFLYASEEARINILRQWAEDMPKQMGYALDVMAMHGVNPATGEASDIIGNNHFDYIIPIANKIVLGHDSSAIDANIEEAISKVEDAELPVTGIAMAPAARTAMAQLTQNSGERKYQDFAFGAFPANLGNGKLDVNATVSADSNKDRVIVGDFANAFKWGFAKELPIEVIEYGNPDGGTYDLKQANQVLLRTEAYIGWGIMNDASFAKVYVNP